jgi:hypothetical protein
MGNRLIPRRASRLAALLACGLFLSLAPAAAQSGPTTTMQDVEVDLSGRLFKSTLPFDVPFLIHGEVPLATTRVEVRYIGARRSFRVCDPEVRAFQTLAAGNPSSLCPVPDRVVCYAEAKRGAGEQPFDCGWQPDRTGAISWVQQLPPAAGATTVTFRVAMPPLEASSFYAFKFTLDRKLTPQELAQIQAQVKQAADQTLAGNTGTVATEDDDKAVRTALVQQIVRLAGPDVQVDRAHPVLDPHVPFEQLSAADKHAFSRHVGGVVSAQHNKEEALKQRSDKQIRLEPKLAAIAGSAALDRVIRTLRDRAAAQQPGSALLGEHLRRHEPALHMADLSPQQRAQHALGVPRNAPAPTDLGAARKAEEAAPYVAGYQDTAQRLADLTDWLEGLLDERRNAALLQSSPAAPGAAPPSSADLAELRQVLDTAAEAQDLAEQLGEHARSVQQSLVDRERELDALAAAMSAKAAEADLLLAASSLGDFRTQQAFYIAADFGIAYGPDLSAAVPYFGTNIYFRPVNKNAPLSSRSSLGRRLAMTVGLTVKTIADSSPQTRSDLFNSNSLLVGLGYRITDSARLGAGTLIFNKLDRNPLLGGKKLTYSLYVSLSFDWDILSFFRGFGAIFPSTP